VRRPFALRSLGAALLSGTLLGAAYWAPAQPALALLAWIWMVPLLLHAEDRPLAFVARAWVAMLVGCSIAMWWMMAFTPGAVALFVAGSFITTVPWLVFALARHLLGERVALLLLAPVWTLWEWTYLGTEAAFGWLVLAVSQPSLPALVQHAELAGTWGISFWLVAANVALVHAWTSGRRPFLQVAVTAVVMLALPVTTGLMRSLTESPSVRTIRIAAIQPNIDPYFKWDPTLSKDAVEKTVEYTDEAMDGRIADLIVWPEAALPFPLATHPTLRPFIEDAVLDWNTPVLAGTTDLPPHRAARGTTFVSSVLLVPDARKQDVQISKPYHKRRLVPFVEYVPWADQWPKLRSFAIEASGGSQWSRGTMAQNFAFVTRSGTPLILGSQICYDAIFPEGSVEHVRKGAQLLAFATNDSWYGRSMGQRIIAAAARLRAVETRRSVVRVANSGLTEFVDRYGRTQAALPEWEARWMIREATLHDGQTLFVRHPNALPLACAVLSFLLLVVPLVRRAQSSPRRSEH
jgi:apolipoprotein N-acyltransferase